MDRQVSETVVNPVVRLSDDKSVMEALKKVRNRVRKLERQAEKDPKRKNGKERLTAKTADRHDLYQRAVQSADTDVTFLKRIYRKANGKDPKHFREDFCGTALLAATWVKQGKAYTAEGFDLDPDPIAWGLDRNFAPLGKAAERCLIHLDDVRKPSEQKPDVRCAQNFSWFVFKSREELLEYFRAVLADLPEDGVFVMDIQGGREAQEEMEEEVEHEGFTYVWDQDAFHPVTSEYLTKIHFRFPDGTEMKNAFRYDWRLWNLTETLEILADAGFTQRQTFWEGTDTDGETGNGVFRPSRLGENCEAWVTYIIAMR